MNIDRFESAILNCRFCFMCRHLSAIGNVRHTEADTPRVRAAMLYGLRTGTNSFDDTDFVDALYRQDLSACCVHHCVNHFDENGLALAARADVVEAGKEPEAVRKLAAVYRRLLEKVEWKFEGKGNIAYLLDETTAADKDAPRAVEKLFKAAKVSPVWIAGGPIGKVFKVLGYLPEAKAAAEKFAVSLKEAGVKTLVVSNPAAYDALVRDYADFGVKLPCKVLHVTQWILGAKLKFAKKPGPGEAPQGARRRVQALRHERRGDLQLRRRRGRARPAPPGARRRPRALRRRPRRRPEEGHPRRRLRLRQARPLRRRPPRPHLRGNRGQLPVAL